MDPTRITLLIIDDDPGDIELLSRYLTDIPEYSFDVLVLTSSKSVLPKLVCKTVDLVFIDFMLGQETGLDVFRSIRDAGCSQPAIMLTGQGNEHIAVEAMKSGMADYIVKNDMDSIKIARAITNALEKARLEQKIESQRKELEQFARTDGLTGLLNRRSFLEKIEDELKRSRRYGMPCSLLMVDLDSFKKLNDTYGHNAGDQALIALSQLFQQRARETDLLCRFGGDEFVIALTNTSRNGATIFSDRIQQAFSDLCITSVDGKQFSATCSIGVAEFSGETLDEFINNADKALYEAKKSKPRPTGIQ